MPWRHVAHLGPGAAGAAGAAVQPELRAAAARCGAGKHRSDLVSTGLGSTVGSTGGRQGRELAQPLVPRVAKMLNHRRWLMVRGG
eukprot:Skav207659  [mRNA]  locus=scaffold382:263951:264205:+ [translate_table: standard]